MVRIICLFIGYVFGIFQTAYIYGKTKGIDIREHGSGNAGTTNALRTLGWKAGAITFLGDCFKCVLAVVLVRLLFGKSHGDMIVLLGLYAAAGAILGHNFPVQLGFRGGKGIACTAGLFVSLDPVLTLIALVSFVGIVALTRYVSLGSIVVVIEFFLGLVVYGQLGKWGLSQAHLYELYALGAFLTLMAIYRHRANIKRLLNGTENKFGAKKKEEVEPCRK